MRPRGQLPPHRASRAAQVGSAVSRFCTELTGITPAVAAGGVPLGQAVAAFGAYLASLRPGSFAVVTHGRWDVEVQLRAEARRKGIELPPALLRYFDLKQEASLWAASTGSHLQKKTLAAIVERLGVAAEPGAREHCGLDDASMIGRAAAVLAGHTVAHPSLGLFAAAEDVGAREASFAAQQSAVAHVTGLSYSATGADLRAWCTSLGLKTPPQALHMCLEPVLARDPAGSRTAPTGDPAKQRPTGEFYVECASHADAKQLIAVRFARLPQHIVIYVERPALTPAARRRTR